MYIQELSALPGEVDSLMISSLHNISNNYLLSFQMLQERFRSRGQPLRVSGEQRRATNVVQFQEQHENSFQTFHENK